VAKDMELAQNELKALAARPVGGAGARRAMIILDEVKERETRITHIAEDPDVKTRLAMSGILDRCVVRASLAR